MTAATKAKSKKKTSKVKKKARVLTPEQLVLLFEYADPWADLYRLAYWAGCRCSEVRQLTADAIQGENVIIMQTKTSAEKRLPIDEMIAPVLKRLPSAGYLFPSPTGNGDKPIGRTSIHNHLSELAADLELNSGSELDKVTTHSFRRSRATHLYKAKMMPVEICKITGHRSVEQLMEYIDIDTDEAAAKAAAITAAAFPGGF